MLNIRSYRLYDFAGRPGSVRPTGTAALQPPLRRRVVREPLPGGGILYWVRGCWRDREKQRQ